MNFTVTTSAATPNRIGGTVYYSAAESAIVVYGVDQNFKRIKWLMIGPFSLGYTS